MATTVINVDICESLAPKTVRLVPELGSTGIPAGSYVLTPSGSIAGRYSFNVIEALVGVFRVAVVDGNGTSQALGQLWIEADDVGPYLVDLGSSNSPRMRWEYSIGDTSSDAKLDNILALLGTPLGPTVSADILQIIALIGTPVFGSLAGEHSNLRTLIGTPAANLAADIAVIDAKMGTPTTDLAADLAAVKVVVDNTNNKIGTPAIDLAADLAAVGVTVSQVDAKIGTPATTVSADIAAIDAKLDATVDVPTSTLDAKLDTSLAELAKVLKSGEEFVTSSSEDVDKFVTFTRR